jgi:hypothetical protein
MKQEQIESLAAQVATLTIQNEQLNNQNEQLNNFLKQIDLQASASCGAKRKASAVATQSSQTKKAMLFLKQVQLFDSRFMFTGVLTFMSSNAE